MVCFGFYEVRNLLSTYLYGKGIISRTYF